MKKTRSEKSRQDRAALVPAAEHSGRESSNSIVQGINQLKPKESLIASLSNSSVMTAQQKAANSLSSSSIKIKQRGSASSLIQAQAEEALPFANSELDLGSSSARESSQTESKHEERADTKVGSTMEEKLAKARQPTAEDAAGSIGKAEVSPWMREVGLRLLGMDEPDEPKKKKSKKPGGKDEPVKADDEAPAKPAVVPAGIPNHFMRTPSKYPKLKKAETSFEKFKEAQEKGFANEAPAKSEGQDDSGSKTSAEEEKQVEGYTDGIIGLVKKGFKNCMALKTAYEEYQLVKENTDEDPSKMEAAKAAFDTALSGTSIALSAIDNYQKSFGAAQALAVKAAIPAVSIVMSTVSLIGRIVTLVKNNKLDFGKTAEESQTDSILSLVQGDEKKKAEVKAILQSEKFRSIVVAAAEYRQQERDNPAIFSEYRKSLDNAELHERLRRRYPDNFARIEEISKNNNMSLDRLGPETKQLMSMGVTSQMLEAIIGDQTLINHLEEVKDKRSTNAKIGIFTDLVNIGGDIATLSGAGAVVGSAMKAGAAAIDVARSGGNAIKFAARAKGATDFSEGAEGGLWGSSIYDSTNILKNDDAKQERYFHSSRRLVENIADHDKRVVDVGTTPNKEQVDSINQAYGWVETKILGTGASVTLIKAMASADSKSANELVGYFIEKMKQR